MYEEIRSAESFRDTHLSLMREMVESYGGNAYRLDWQASHHENHFYEFIRLVTSKVVFDNPKIIAKTRRPGTQKMVALAIQHALNRWSRDVQIRGLLERLFIQQCFAFAATQTTMVSSPWMDPREESVPRWPMTFEIEPDRFIMDPLARSFGQARFVGHMWVRSKAQLIEAAEAGVEEGWDIDQVKSLAEDTGLDDLPDRKDRKFSLSRGEIVGYDVWVPEYEMDDAADGFHGTVFTLAVAHSADKQTKSGFIRKPRPYWGPRTGPYTMYGCYPVPGDPYPLSPFAATYDQIKALNEIVGASNRSINQYKRVVFVSADNPDLAKKLKQSPDAFVVPIRGFQKEQIQEVSMGGITQQHIEQIRDALERVDRNTGMSETQRGAVRSGATATEISVADAAHNDSIAMLRQSFADSVSQMLRKVAWFIYHEDRVRIPLGEESIDSFVSMSTGGRPVEPTYYGGEPSSEEEGTFDDLELQIEAYSMSRMSEAVSRAQYQNFLELVIQAAPIIPQAPFIDWERLFQKAGEVFNDSSFEEIFIGDPSQFMSQMGMGAAPIHKPEADTGRGMLPGVMAGAVQGQAQGVL